MSFASGRGIRRSVADCCQRSFIIFCKHYRFEVVRSVCSSLKRSIPCSGTMGMNSSCAWALVS